MPEKLSSLLWTRYGAEQWPLLLEVIELGTALEFLSLDSEAQGQAVPTCQACEAWYGHVVPIKSAMQSQHLVDVDGLAELLEAIWTRCNDLDDQAFHCDDHEIFRHEAWEPIRASARAALDLIEWPALREHVTDLKEQGQKFSGS